MRIISISLLLLLGGVLAYASGDLPSRGDPQAPASVHVSPHYIENSLVEMETPNMVTAVLADYRAFDTFGEAVVVFTAALSCLLILIRRRREEEGDEGREGRA